MSDKTMQANIENCPFCGTKPMHDEFGDMFCGNDDCPCNEVFFTFREWQSRHNNPEYHVIKKSDVDGDIDKLINLLKIIGSKNENGHITVWLTENHRDLIINALIAQSDPDTVTVEKLIKDIVGLCASNQYVDDVKGVGWENNPETVFLTRLADFCECYEKGIDPDIVRAWQPIETAPKDGTMILGYFCHTMPDMRLTPVKWDMDDIFFKDCWLDPNGSAWTEPDYWMPLPTPPINDVLNYKEGK